MVLSDLYNDLDVSKDATDDEIKDAYRKKARSHHPDLGGDEEKFKKSLFAYNVLKDSTKREKYDRTGNTETEDTNSAAKQILANLIASIIADPRFDPKKSDLFEAVSGEVSTRKKAFKKNSKSLVKLIAKFEEANKRIESDDSYFSNVVEDKRKFLNNELEEFNVQIEICNNMKELVSKARYKFDECSTTNSTSYGSFSSFLST